MRVKKYMVLFGTEQYKKEMHKCVDKIRSLEKDVKQFEKSIGLQTFTDAYKDDLIKTLEALLVYKNDMIGDLKEKLRLNSH